MTFPVSSGGFQYYLPVTEWETENLEVKIDLTYRDLPGNSAICNISIINKDRTPRFVSSAFFGGDGNDYLLENIEKLLVNTRNSTYRITSTLPGDSLKALLSSASITLTLNVDGTVYVCTPPDTFLRYRDELLMNIE